MVMGGTSLLKFSDTDEVDHSAEEGLQDLQEHGEPLLIHSNNNIGSV